MPKPIIHRLLRAETLTALGIIAGAAAFLFPTTELPRLSALLPTAMLIALLVLSAILLITDQMKAAAGEDTPPVTEAPKRVIGAFILIVLYTLAVNFVGFYPSTAVSVPLVAYAFGYRNPLGLLVATLIVLAAVYLIFGFAMSKEFPTGQLWPM